MNFCMDALLSQENVHLCCGRKKVFRRPRFQWLGKDGVVVVVVDNRNILIALYCCQRETTCLVTVDIARQFYYFLMKNSWSRTSGVVILWHSWLGSSLVDMTFVLFDCMCPFVVSMFSLGCF